jgi:hypothetical protein
MPGSSPSPIKGFKVAFGELEARAKNAEQVADELRKSLDEVKKEKADKEKVLEERVEKLREDLAEAR